MKRSRTAADEDAPHAKRPKLLRDTLGLPRKNNIVHLYWSGYQGVRRRLSTRLLGATSVLDQFCQEHPDTVIRKLLSRLLTEDVSRLSFTATSPSTTRLILDREARPEDACICGYHIYLACALGTTMDIRLALPKPMFEMVRHGRILNNVMKLLDLYFAPSRGDKLLKCIYPTTVLFQDAKTMDHTVLWIVVCPVIARNPHNESVYLAESVLVVNNPPRTDMFSVHGFV